MYVFPVHLHLHQGWGDLGSACGNALAVDLQPQAAGSAGTVLGMTPLGLPDTGSLPWLQRQETHGVSLQGLEVIATERGGHTFMTSKGWLPTLEEATLSLLPSFDQY